MHKVAHKVLTILSPLDDAQPSYSEYTCYTGISDFTPADIDVVSGAVNEEDFRLLVLNTEKPAACFKFMNCALLSRSATAYSSGLRSTL